MPEAKENSWSKPKLIRKVGNEMLWGIRALKFSDIFLGILKGTCMPRALYMLRKDPRRPRALSLAHFRSLHKQEVKTKVEL